MDRLPSDAIRADRASLRPRACGGDVTVAALLAVSAVVLGGVTAATARRPAVQAPGLEVFLDRWSRLHGGYDPRGSTWVRVWLVLTYRVAAPLARRGVQPEALTAWGAWLALAALVAAAAGGRWPVVAGLALVTSSLADALDGGVAALTDRATRWGEVLDSFVDRVADGVYLAAVWVVGGLAWLAVLAGTAVALLEYLRARAASAGMTDVGVVTVGERPTRVICCAGALLSAGALPAHAGPLVNGWLVGLALLSVAGVGQLLVEVRRTLR